MTSHPTRHRMAWEAEARALYRDMPDAELQATRQPLACNVAEAASYDRVQREVVDLLDCARLRMVDAELARRMALFRAGADVDDPHDPTSAAWADLAQRVRPEADIVHLLRLAGCQLERSGRGEWCGPCPFCGGHDRFRVWDRDSGSHPRYWCRRCNASGDAISAFRDLLQPGSSFFDALRWIGLELGIYETPDFGSRRPPRINLGELRPRVNLGELRHAG